MENIRISIASEICTLCGLCVSVCPRGIIELGSETAQIKNPDRCMLCGHCKSVCPVDAPRLYALNGEEFEPVPGPEKMPEPDDLLSFFRSRRSTRIYKKDPVSLDQLEKMVQAGRFAPTGGNRQPVRYVILHTPEMIETMRTLTHQYLADEADKILETAERHKTMGEPLPPRFGVRMGYSPLWKSMGKNYRKGKDLLFHFAPAVAVLHADPDTSSPFCADMGLAAMQMVLMAHTLGLGTCFCGFLVTAVNNCPELKAALKIPPENSAVLSFMIGHPDIAYLRMVSRQPAEITYL
jgi:nitroreductase/NAD-dependent dihydropyrimidine dehydrogenase PreA subunit